MRLALVGLALGLTSLTSACGEGVSKGQIMLAITSQMPVPKDIREVSAEVRFLGRRQYFARYKIDQNASDAERLPGLLSIVEGTRREPVKILVGAWDAGGKLRVARQVTTTVPDKRAARLSVELEWFCLDKVKPTSDLNEVERDDNVEISADCGEGETCIAGRCVSEVVDERDLPDFLERDVLAPPGDRSQCFDVKACFDAAPRVFVASNDPCEIDRPEGGQGINVALELAPGGPGFCTDASCLIPLSGYSESGWTLESSRLRFPTAACSAIADGSVLGIVVTTKCPTKTRSIATCPD